MNRHLLTLLMLLLFFTISATSALAENRMGFRLTLGSVPGIEEVETTDPFGTTNVVTVDAERGFNFNPAFVFRSNVEKPVGFVGVVGGFIRDHTGEDIVGDEATLTAFGVNLAPGLAIRLGERAHLEFRGELGLGSAVHDIDGFEDEGSGPYVSFGANAGAYFNVGRVVVLGFDVGYLDFESEGEVDDFFDTYDTEMRGSGTTLNASIGFMF